MKRFIFASVAALAATGVTAEPLTELIGNKAYWKAMAWEKAEQSKIWKLNGWRPYEGGQTIGRTFTKERPAEIDGKNLRAKLIVEEAPRRQNILSITSLDLSADECEQINSWLARKFGQPKIVADGSYKYDWAESVDKRSQWDIGSTRATFVCVGVKTSRAEQLGEKNALVVALTFGSKASERELKPLFGLRCTQRIEYIGIAGAPKNLDDIVLVIDENRNRVRSANRTPLPGEHRITEDAIDIKIKKEDHTIEYFIDRYTGVFKGKLRYLKKGGGGNMSGRCEKSKPGERKF